MSVCAKQGKHEWKNITCLPGLHNRRKIFDNHVQYCDNILMQVEIKANKNPGLKQNESWTKIRKHRLKCDLCDYLDLTYFHSR